MFFYSCSCWILTSNLINRIFFLLFIHKITKVFILESPPTSTADHSASATTQHINSLQQPSAQLPHTPQQQQQQQQQTSIRNGNAQSTQTQPLPLLEQRELNVLHTVTIPPYQFWNSEFRNKQPAFIRFNFTLPWGANFAVYGRRNVAPSVTQYDFVEFIKGGRVDHRLRRKRSADEGKLYIKKFRQLFIIHTFRIIHINLFLLKSSKRILTIYSSTIKGQSLNF